MAMEGGRLLEELRTQVHTILEEHAQDELTDSHPSVRPLCLCLEAVLRCGLSSKSSFFGGRKDYFDFLEAALKKTKPRLLKMPARTSAGKGRLLIRHALTTREFAECIQIAAQHTRAIKDFYSEGALLREKATQADLMDLLYHLNNLTFQLADLPDGADIDADWPPSPSSSMHVPEWEVHDAATDEQQQPVAQEETDTQPLPNSNGHTVATPHKVAPAQEEDAAQLQQRIVDLERALAEAHSHNSALTEQVAQITNDHDTQLADAKTQHETKLADAKEQHETRVKELEAQLEKSAGDSEALVKELQSKLRASTEAQESVTSELEAAKQQVSELGEAKTALETRLADAKTQHETQLADAKEQHETRVKELEVQLEKSAGDSEALVKELQSKLRQSTEAQESVTSKLEAANQQVSELGEAKTVLEEELQASRTTVSELEQRLSGLSGNLEESSNKHSLDLATLQSNYDACRFELSDLKMRLRSAEKEREDLQDELKHVQLASEKHAAASAREREMLTQELQMVKETNKQLDAKTRQLHEEIGATEAETARLQSDLDESKRKLEEVTKARDELQEENEGLRADLVTRTMAKAQLWSDHVTSQLKEDELRPVPQESWEDDDTVHTCPFCKSEFSFFFRKHHCRQCGKVVCDDCSQAHMHVRGYPEPQRCCKACAPRLRKQAQQQQAH